MNVCNMSVVVTNYYENKRRGRTGVQQCIRKIFLLRTITNTDGEELITDAHEISVQSAVMSGLEDVNSSQLYVALH